MTAEAVVTEPMEPTVTRILAAALAVSLALAGSAAQAQSYTAPAGIPAQTASSFHGR